MVSKTSEYRQQYRPAVLVKNIPAYYESLTYRNHRRELEYSHTPISWDFELVDAPEGKNEEDKISLVDLKLEDIEEEVKESGEKIKEEREKKIDEQQDIDCQKKEDADVEESAKCLAETDQDDVLIDKQTSKTRELTKIAKQKLKKYIGTENKDSQKKISHKDESKLTDKELLNLKEYYDDLPQPKKVEEKTFTKKPRRPDRISQRHELSKSAAASKSKQNVPRPKSGASLCPSTADSIVRPPFMAYGSGDSELVTGQKRTHNVHCSTDIYPAAVKARQQHLLRAKKLEDLRKKILAQQKRRKHMFATKISRETTAWQSEYQKQYSSYDLEEYARRYRALDSARARKVKCDL